MLEQISNNKKITDGIGFVIASLAIFLLAVTVTEVKSWFDGASEYPAKTITVNGSAEVKAVPDIATFSFSVSEFDASTEVAQNKATEKTNTAIDFLKEQGIEDKDIKTESYNIYPRYENTRPCTAFDCPPSEPEISGYQVSQTIVVKVRERDNAGDILSELGKIGVSNVSSLSFSTDDEDVYIDQAKAEAIADARMEAEKLAKELDVRLGDVISFGENQNYPYNEAYGYGGDTQFRTLEASVKTSPQLPVGENTYVSNVWVTFEIK